MYSMLNIFVAELAAELRGRARTIAESVDRTGTTSDYGVAHGQGDGHGFTPMGCGCGYASSEASVQVSNLRVMVYRARRRANAATDTIERARTIVQHWRTQSGFNASLIDALGVALDAYDREPKDG